jgi:hypothetical protein
MIKGGTDMPKTEDKVRENYLRRWAKRLGLILRKSRAKRLSLDNYGGYQIITINNWIYAGERYNLDLEDVEGVLEAYEAQLREAANEH